LGFGREKVEGENAISSLAIREKRKKRHARSSHLILFSISGERKEGERRGEVSSRKDVGGREHARQKRRKGEGLDSV